jgi:hypothetical protein
MASHHYEISLSSNTTRIPHKKRFHRKGTTKRHLTFAYGALSYMAFLSTSEPAWRSPHGNPFSPSSPHVASSARVPARWLLAALTKHDMSACPHLAFLYRQSSKAPFEHAFAEAFDHASGGFRNASGFGCHDAVCAAAVGDDVVIGR